MEQPQRFGRFFLFREDEGNGYRTVYRAGLARGRTIERIIRLEAFDRSLIEAVPFLKCLEDSTGLQDKLRDPHIAPGAGVGQVEGTPYTAYDFELGTTLSTFMSAAREQSFPVPFDQALFVGERIALALAAAYRLEHNDRPILHSFLTPDSVLLSNEGEVKVSGFEVGNALREQLAPSPSYAAYLSPQSRAGSVPADHDDVFSLGSILFELVTGKPLAIESVDLDHSVVQATGEPIPDNLRQLLARSFAPPATRIPDVLAWQQNLGKVILDGEYNPTTFNLAFLIHTLLREPLKRGAEHLTREKRFLLPAPGDDESTQETTAVPAPAPPAAMDPPDPMDPVVPITESTVDTPADRSFWLGFSISGVAAGAIFLLLLTLGSGSDPAPASALASPGEAVTNLPLAKDLPATSFTTAETQTDSSPAQPASLVLTEVVNGELGQPNVDEGPDSTAEPGAEIERLKAEYELELERLRKQIQDSQRVDPAAKDRPRPAVVSELSQPAELSRLSETLTKPDAASVSAPAPQGEPTGPAPPEASAEADTPLVKIPESAASEPTQTEVSAPAAGAAPVETDRLDVPAEVAQLTQPELAAAEPVVSTGTATATQTRAQLLRLVPPTYPVAARRLGLSASARVNVLISAQGKVKQAEIVGPRLGSGFDSAALAAARKSRWQAATRDGEPVESWHAVTIEFRP